MKKKGLAALAYIGAFLAIVGYGYKHRHAASIGIIGGADGPTAIFVAGQTGMMFYAGMALLLIVLVLLAVRIWKNRK